LKFSPGRLTKNQVVLITIFIIEGAVAYGLWELYSSSHARENPAPVEGVSAIYVYKPSVTIGCSRVVWKDTQVHLAASTNIRYPQYQWLLDNKTIGTERELLYNFAAGKYNILLKAVSGNDSAQDDMQVIAVGSTGGISADAVSGSMSNERVFVTKFKDAFYYIDGVSVTLDGKDIGTIPECRKLTVSGLFAGSHKWKATYHSKDIGSGEFQP